jgi:hypothetical protein
MAGAFFSVSILWDWVKLVRQFYLFLLLGVESFEG